MNQTSGISFASVLGIVFIVLKLCGVIDWSWWWVLAPFWIPLAIGLVLFAAAVVVTSIGGKSWRS